MCYVRLLFLLSCNFLLLHGQERITSFISDIVVNADATLHVQETIEVICEHKEIFHGIVREFPTKYRDAHGIYYVVDFAVQSVTHNGYVVPYTIKSVSNGKQLYIGDKNSLVPRGKHRYVIHYDTNRQLGFFKDHDELYWNVTGTGWRLPIDSVQAHVQLPAGVARNAISAQAYTGYQDEQGNNYSYTINDSHVIFATKYGLKPSQGLTIVATFPKGLIVEPTQYQKIVWFFRDNFLILLLCIGLFLFAMFLISGVITVRRRNMPGVVIPLFYPPVGMMPSVVGFMNKMQFENFLLLPDIVDLGVRNFITITYTQNMLYGGTYTLTIKDSIISLKNNKNVSDYDKALLLALFGTTQSITISEKHSAEIQAALQQCKIHTNKQSSSYLTVLTHFWYGACLLLLLLLCGIFLFLFDFTIELLIPGVFITLLSIPFFKKLFTIYTPAGRSKQDAIDGFKLYLATAEIERMNLIGTPPTKTPELYEKYLPYAIALGIEKQWTSQFSGVFEKFEQEKGRPYYPLWYHGTSFKADHFGSKFTSSFTSAIVASSSRPGSFSGSGGKGRSGGGGGGGGGGGW